MSTELTPHFVARYAVARRMQELQKQANLSGVPALPPVLPPASEYSRQASPALPPILPPPQQLSGELDKGGGLALTKAQRDAEAARKAQERRQREAAAAAAAEARRQADAARKARRN